MSFPRRHALPTLLAGLRAAGEETRLRILALLADGELSVSDLTDILGQSQPRISRHLKLLAEAGLIRRSREGAFAFYRLARDNAGGALSDWLSGVIDPADRIVAADRERLGAVRAHRAAAAQNYFARIARDWDRLGSLHASDEAIEREILAAVGPDRVGALLDLGTGTGRMLQVLSPCARRLVGVDASHAMLQVARSNLEKAGLSRVELRQGDAYALALTDERFDVVLIHQVLHFLDDPGRALREAARVIAPGGQLIVVDFAPHDLEFLRAEQAHRRLGFTDDEIGRWFTEAGLDAEPAVRVPAGESGRLTVMLWRGRNRRVGTLLTKPAKEVA